VEVLIVRLSSMGDMVHTLPAVTDAAKALPGVKIDWLVDHSFADIPFWHRDVRRVFAAPHRQVSNLGSREFKNFLKDLRSVRYDLVIDLQGHWKSAIAAKLARGTAAGYESKSVNELGAQLFYKKKYFVARNQHSIQRMRQLLAKALNYSWIDEWVEFGIDRSRLPLVPIRIPSPYIVFIHSTSWESKCWNEDQWRELAEATVRAGFHVVLPWGNEKERERSKRIAGNQPEATVLPPLSISEKASVLLNAAATVGLDTGLSHIAAALDVPSVTLYGATDPDLIGATGKNQLLIASKFECVKCHRSICKFPGNHSGPACFQEITPPIVWKSLERLLPASTLSGSTNRSK
jgi:heptosyltransferase-1